jgi:hypothetical protein
MDCIFFNGCNTQSVPNKRSKGQKPISLWIEDELLVAIERGLGTKFADRSAFIRRAVIEKLRRDGIEVDEALAFPPRRAGKGGRPTHKKSRNPSSGARDPEKKATEAMQQIVSYTVRKMRKP